jgi:hypothetical protein
MLNQLRVWMHIVVGTISMNNLMKCSRKLRPSMGRSVLFVKNAHDLYLVSNVRISAKFKVPGFEKYRGNSCP